MKWIFALIFVSVCVGTGSALKCYNCATGVCNDPFSATDATEETCTAGVDDACLKSKLADVVTLRGCASSSVCSSAGGTDSCKSAEALGIRADNCCCTTELCNSATKGGVSAVVLVMAGLLANAAF
ncbi:uncharacterized protein LOC119725245 [Patiria miniata]|uniref:Uncharacterized protein n=1 Tax=Patiria miniata TaxID=46514 RepID=A0A913ZME4_PATMI|nr:uncharacterized protein LOC119725245 [Patiria miniata]